MLLHEVISEITDLTRGSCVISHLGVEGPWCRKEGLNKYLPEYLDTQAGLTKIFDQVRKHRKQQSKNKTNAPDPNIITRNLPGSDDTGGSKKKGKQAATAIRSAPASGQLNDAQAAYKDDMAKITAKLLVKFKCDEHGHLCARLPGAHNHVTYTHHDVQEHAQLLYRNAPGVTYDVPPEALNLLDRKPLDSYSATAAAERIPKSSTPIISTSGTVEAEQPQTHQPGITVQTTPAVQLQVPSLVQAAANTQLPSSMMPPFHPSMIPSFHHPSMVAPFHPSMMPPFHPLLMPSFNTMQSPFMERAMLGGNVSTGRRPRDWSLIGNWLESLHDDMERGKEPCPPYRAFRSSFEKRGYVRLDDIQDLCKGDLEKIVQADGLNATDGLINHILCYAKQDCATIQSGS
ncbi:hypothetical protein ACEPAG_4104 [Sanghuangporus baumii]